MADDLTIYEVRSCSTCRNLAALLDERGIDYDGVEYHETGLDEATIRSLLQKSGLTPRESCARASRWSPSSACSRATARATTS